MAARVVGEHGVALAAMPIVCATVSMPGAVLPEPVHEDHRRPAAGRRRRRPGSVSVAASAVPSADAIVTSWREKAPRGRGRDERRDDGEKRERARGGGAVTAAKGSPRL